MPEVEITLEQFGKFLEKLEKKTVRRIALLECVDILKQSLFEKVFTNHNDTYNIPTKDELRRLIKSGAKPKKAPPYSEEYLKRKKRMGENKPHKYENYGFWSGIDVRYDSGSLVMEVEELETNEKGMEYMVIHESRRSVLKLAFLRAWEEIMEKIIEKYADEAKGVKSGL